MSSVPAGDYGPLSPLLDDPAIVEIMVDPPGRITVERGGRIEAVDAHFDTAAQLLQVIRAIISPFGRTIDEVHPLVDLRLPDRSLLTAVMPPVSPHGPALVIRKFFPSRLSINDLVRLDAWSPAIVTFLQACVAGGVTILVAGGAGSGKTTVMNLLCSMIPAAERLIVIERAPELDVEVQRGLRLEAGSADSRGATLTVRDLVSQALKMRPDRLLLGELQGEEVPALVQAIRTGYTGSMATLHATSARDALARLEMMLMAAEPAASLLSVREQLAGAFDLVVQVNRLGDGVRRVTRIAEVTGMDRDQVALRDIFVYTDGPRDAGGRLQGQFAATGYVPTFLPRLRQRGVTIPMDVFAQA